MSLKSFKTISTLGPSSSDNKIIKELSKLSNKFRLNSSHMEPKDLEHWLLQLKELKIPVVVDLQGAKMRIGNYPNVDKIPNKEVNIIFANYSDDINHVPVPHKALFDSVKVGETLSLNDSKVILLVLDNSGKKIHAKIIQNGPLSSNKGINRKDHPIPFTSLSDRDKAFIDVAIKFDFTEFAFSFVFDGSEHEIIKNHIKNKRIAAKIERLESFKFLEKIDSSFDELWLCRGDLGAQAGIDVLGRLQSEFIATFSKLKKEKYLAGQVLEHMTHFPQPTRSEVVHLYDIQKSGFNGIVLSDETAIGKNPVTVLEILNQLAIK